MVMFAQELLGFTAIEDKLQVGEGSKFEGIGYLCLGYILDDSALALLGVTGSLPSRVRRKSCSWAKAEGSRVKRYNL